MTPEEKPHVPVLSAETIEDSHATLDALATLDRPAITSELIRGKPHMTRAELLARGGLAPGLVKKPHIDTMLTMAYVTAAEELRRLHKISAEDGLTAVQTGQFEKLINAVTKLAKEEREQVRQDRIDEMTDEELEKMYQEMKDE